MADRTASVALELKAGQFKAEASTVEAKVRGVDRAVDELDRDITKIPADAARAGAAMKLLSGDVGNVKSGIDQLGHGSGAIGLLDQRIKNTRAEVKKLTTEFEKTGDVSVFRKLGQAHADLGALTKIRKDLTNALDSATKDSANTFAQLFQGGIINAFKNPYVLAGAAGLAALIGPLIGAAIGGAVIAAGAAGAVALGVAGAVQADPKRIGAAWDAEISRIKAEWISASTAFVGPTESAIHRLGSSVSHIDLNGILSKASTFVRPLTEGAAGFAEAVGRGVEALVSKAGPIVEVLKDELPEVGSSIEKSLSLIAGGNKGAAEGLRDILHITEAVIEAFGVTVRLTEDIWHGMQSVTEEAHKIADAAGLPGLLWDQLDPIKPKTFAVSLDGVAHGLDKVGESAESGLGSLDALNSSLSKTAVTVDTVWSGMVDKALNQMLGLDRATLGWEESLTRLSESVKQNGKSLDIHTAKGQANRSAILDGVAANQRLYDAEVASGTSAEEAGKHFQANEDALRAAGIAAGLNTGELDKMIKKYGNVPPTIQTQIEMHGLTEAISNLDETLRLINHMPPRKSVDIDVNVHGNLFSAAHAIADVLGSGFVSSGLGKKKKALGGIRHAAEGMIVPPSDPGTILMGEPQTKGEALIPLGGISPSSAMGLAQTVGNSYGFSVSPNGRNAPAINVHVSIAPGNGRAGLASLLTEMQRIGQLPFAVKVS